jgi:2-haloacid dehalogenase
MVMGFAAVCTVQLRHLRSRVPSSAALFDLYRLVHNSSLIGGTTVTNEEKITRRDALGVGVGAAALAAAPGPMYAQAVRAKPVLVFDVNETLLDIDALNPLFDRIFGVPGRMREWFAQLILYSQSLSLAGRYAPFGALGAGVLRMLGTIHGVQIRNEDVEALRTAIATLPVHAEVPNALRRLSAAGFRMVTLTNTPPAPGPDALTLGGVGNMFEQRFTVDPVRRFKPAPETYRLVTDTLRVPPNQACMIAAHTWDTLGAQAAGWTSALITRRVNAVLDAPDVPKPDIVETDLVATADRIIEKWA